MKKLTAILLALCLLLCLCAGCADRSPSDDPSRESSSSLSSQREEPESDTPDLSTSAPKASSSESEESPAPESPAEDPPASQPSAGSNDTELDFSTMDKEELIALLQPVLDRARYFCRFALMGDMENIEVDYDPDAAIKRPFRNDEEYVFYPFLNLPYGTVEELKEDMCTVFTPDNMEGDSILARYVFGHLADHDGKLYFASGLGYLNAAERRWELDGLEIVSAEKTRLTITAPVSWGPMTETITAPLNFEIKDGYIVMDSSYFANDVS